MKEKAICFLKNKKIDNSLLFSKNAGRGKALEQINCEAEP